MSANLYMSVNHRIPLYKNVPGQLSRVQSGWVNGVIDIYIDVDALIRSVGYTVLRSKGKKSVLKSGAIVFKARDVEEHTVEGAGQ